MAQITVHRKAYTRKDGTRVKAASYTVSDKGKPGKTPEGKKFFHPKTKLNWHKDSPAAARRASALRALGGNTLATARALQELSNVTTDAETKRLSKEDADYFFSKHKQ